MTLRTIYLILFSFTLSETALSQEASSIRAGPNMAVLEANLKDGFRLAEKAKKVIGLKTENLKSNPYSVPANSLVYYGDKVGIYRLRDGWFKLIEIKVIGKNGSQSTISTNEFKEGDQIAVEGVALLRVSEMDAFGGEE